MPQTFGHSAHSCSERELKSERERPGKECEVDKGVETPISNYLAEYKNMMTSPVIKGTVINKF